MVILGVNYLGGWDDEQPALPVTFRYITMDQVQSWTFSSFH